MYMINQTDTVNSEFLSFNFCQSPVTAAEKNICLIMDQSMNAYTTFHIDLTE